MILSPRHTIAATILTLLFSSSVAAADRLADLRESAKRRVGTPQFHFAPQSSSETSISIPASIPSA